MSEDKKPRHAPDWEAIEREYRAGALSLRTIAAMYGVTEGAVRKRALKLGWERALAEKVRKQVSEKLARLDGTQNGTRPQRDAEIVEAASLRGLEVVTSHRRDLAQLHALKRTIAMRLAAHLNGEPPEGPFIGEKESPGDLLDKLSRIDARLIPMERQAHNLDEAPVAPISSKTAEVLSATDPVEAARAYHRLVSGTE